MNNSHLTAQQRLDLRTALERLMPQMEHPSRSIREKALAEWDRVNREVAGVPDEPQPTEQMLAARREIEVLKGDQKFQADLRNPSDPLLRQARGERWNALFATAYNPPPKPLLPEEQAAKESARRFLDDLKLRPDHPLNLAYNDSAHPGHLVAIERMAEHHKWATLGEEQTGQFEGIHASIPWKQ